MKLKKNGKTIVLNMIVKNESKIIERCIKSVYDLIDSWCIIDTGSTDGTQELIKNLLKDKPGELIERPWINFGHNRNEALEFAQDWADWILLVDADMVLKNEGFKKESLNPNIEAYDVIQTNHGTSYYNFRLLNTKRKWKCIGVTHEYYDCEGGLKTRDKLSTIWFDDISDGGSKDDKFERDIRLLTQGLIDEPWNERYMFYLAQSYRDTREWDDAIHWYVKRVDAGGWEEEVWYSQYMVGWCKVQRGDNWYDFLPDLQKAWSMRPWRSEPVWMLGLEARKRGMLEQAYAFSKIAAQTPKPQKDLLFIADAAYDFVALDEFSVAAFHTGRFQECETACTHLLNNPNIDPKNKGRIRKNLWFAQKNMGRFNENELFEYIKQKKAEI
jgi:glycosyltransferase involved in cell wall biosynthesis